MIQTVWQEVIGFHPQKDGNNSLASQPTLSRFENAVDVPAQFRLPELFVTQFLEAFETPPARLTFDLDGFNDPAHG